MIYYIQQNVQCTLVKADVGFCSSYIYYCLNEAVERKMNRFFQTSVASFASSSLLHCKLVTNSFLNLDPWRLFWKTGLLDN